MLSEIALAVLRTLGLVNAFVEKYRNKLKVLLPSFKMLFVHFIQLIIVFHYVRRFIAVACSYQ